MLRCSDFSTLNLAKQKAWKPPIYTLTVCIVYANKNVFINILGMPCFPYLVNFRPTKKTTSFKNKMFLFVHKS